MQHSYKIIIFLLFSTTKIILMLTLNDHFFSLVLQEEDNLKYSKAFASWTLLSSVIPYFKGQVVHWLTLKLKTTNEWLCIIRDKNIRSPSARGSHVCEVSIVILNYSQPQSWFLVLRWSEATCYHGMMKSQWNWVLLNSFLTPCHGRGMWHFMLLSDKRVQ